MEPIPSIPVGNSRKRAVLLNVCLPMRNLRLVLNVFYVVIFSDFLENLDDSSFFNQNTNMLGAPVVPVQGAGPDQQLYQSATGMTAHTPPSVQAGQNIVPIDSNIFLHRQNANAGQTNNSTVPVNTTTNNANTRKSENNSVLQVLPSATKREKFLLMAADQEPGSRNERLQRVINAKYEAGLLKPYNYTKGYARLSKWMERK